MIGLCFALNIHGQQVRGCCFRVLGLAFMLTARVSTIAAFVSSAKAITIRDEANMPLQHKARVKSSSRPLPKSLPSRRYPCLHSLRFRFFLIPSTHLACSLNTTRRLITNHAPRSAQFEGRIFDGYYIRPVSVQLPRPKSLNDMGVHVCHINRASKAQ